MGTGHYLSEETIRVLLHPVRTAIRRPNLTRDESRKDGLLRRIPNVNCRCFDVGYKNYVFPDAHIFCCFEVESVNLLVTAQRTAADVGRKRNAFAFSGQEWIVSSVPHETRRNHALTGRT